MDLPIFYASVHMVEIFPGQSHLDFFPGTGAAHDAESGVYNFPVSPLWATAGAERGQGWYWTIGKFLSTSSKCWNQQGWARQFGQGDPAHR